MNSKQREELQRISAAFIMYPVGYGLQNLQCKMSLQEIKDIVDTILAEPPRNCDVGTPEEQAKKWYWRYCQGHKCHTCPLGPRKWSETDKFTLCFSEWLQMPYDEGGAK